MNSCFLYSKLIDMCWDFIEYFVRLITYGVCREFPIISHKENNFSPHAIWESCIQFKFINKYKSHNEYCISKKKYYITYIQKFILKSQLKFRYIKYFIKSE